MECVRANSAYNVIKRDSPLPVDPPGFSTVVGWGEERNEICYFNITVLRKETGSILLYPFNKDIQID